MKKIFVVDDEQIVRRALERVFTADGYEVVTAEDGNQAISNWTKVQPDVVFLDVLMPGKSGVQVLQEISADPKCKIVLMSAYTGEYNLEKAQAIGAHRFVPKPFDDINELKSLVKELLGE